MHVFSYTSLSKMILYIFFFSIIAVHGMVQPHQPQPYSFGYAIKDHDGSQHRQESGNGAGVVKGNYGFIDNKGIHRQVDYMADHAGFRAQIKTNEPGTAGQSPAAVNMISNNPYAHGAAVPYVSRVNDHVVPALYESNGVHGFPTLYGHRAYHHGHYEPQQGYKYIMQMRESKHHMPNHHHDHHAPLHTPLHHHSEYIPAPMPSHHHDHLMPVHMPSHHHDHHMPVHMPSHHDRMPIHMPLDMNDHYMPVHVPAHHHDYNMPSDVPSYSHIPHYSYADEHGYDHKMYSPMYMGGLAHSGLLGAGYRSHGGIVNYGANLVGGVIRGHDSRFSNL